MYCGEVAEAIQPLLPIGMKTPTSIVQTSVVALCAPARTVSLTRSRASRPVMLGGGTAPAKWRFLIACGQKMLGRRGGPSARFARLTILVRDGVGFMTRKKVA